MGPRFARVASAWRSAQHRNASYLMLNAATGAVAGVAFWFLLARVAGLAPAQVGIGYAIVALGTTVGLLAKGGLDTALLRTVPGAGREEGRRLLRFGILVGAGAAVALAAGLALAGGVASGGGLLPHLGLAGWALVAAIGVLLVATWLQDAYFLAEGDARYTFGRNLVFSAARLLLPVPAVLLAVPHPVPLTWALGLAASALAAVGFARRVPAREGRDVPRREFMRTAGRNVTGSAAEFLPGLLLAPIVLAVEGPAAAAYFGIAWTGASLLFLLCGAISRSALAEMVRTPAAGAAVLRRAVLQNLAVVVPAAVLGIVLAPFLLGTFGPDYAREGAATFAVLCASVVLVAPSYLYLSVLRARERVLPLVLFPLLMVVALLAAAPLLESRFGLEGVALAWIAANTPFGLYAAWRLVRETNEVRSRAAQTLRGPPHLE